MSALLVIKFIIGYWFFVYLLLSHGNLIERTQSKDNRKYYIVIIYAQINIKTNLVCKHLKSPLSIMTVSRGNLGTKQSVFENSEVIFTQTSFSRG